MRVVIDPNVWVSALINPYGAPARVVEAVMSGQVVALLTQQLIDELAGVLMRPKFRRWIKIADALAFIEALEGTAEWHPNPSAVPQRVRDPGDDYLVALAETAQVRIVTGDPDLLEATLNPPPISPHKLIELLAG
jgi:putative PIN family toxin of toxin-antitoxin system